MWPTCLSLAGFTLVVLMKNLTGYSELVINRGVGLGQVAQILFFEALPLASQMLPFAVLVGALVGLGRLAADREIGVLSALAIDPRQLRTPVTSFGLLAAIVGLASSLFVAPWAHRGLSGAFVEIAAQHPGAGLQPGVVERRGDWQLLAREVSADGRELTRVLLWVPSIGETVFARKGEITVGERRGNAIRLRDGVLIRDTRGTPTAVRFDEARMELPASEDLASADAAAALDGMSIAPLLALARSGADDPLAHRARSELHGRFALPLSTVLFALLALPLTLRRARPSRSSGAILGLAFTLAYYGLVQLATGLGQRFPEWAGPIVWLPDGVLLVGTLTLHRWLASPWRRPWRLGRRRWRARLPSWRSRSAPIRIRSRRWALPRYVAGRFIQLVLVCFAVLVTAYLLVDVLERLQWFVRHGARLDEILHFYSARIPLLVSRVVPMGLLVAMALTVGLLTSSGELIGMRSCGISAHRALRPALLVCLIAVPLSFLLNDQIVSRTNELADLIKSREIKDGGTQRTAVWNTHGDVLYQLESLDTTLGTADGIVFYELAEHGLPETRFDAHAAHSIGGGLWRLQEATGVELDADRVLRLLPPPETVELGETPSSELDPNHLSVEETRALIREYRASGSTTSAFEVDLHMKLATPLACLLLPALVIVFAVSGPPFPSSASTLVLAGGIAVAYTILSGVSASLGRSDVLAPWLAGWGPSLLAVIGLLWLGGRARALQRGG